jgi:DNA polymerase-3 subunit delta'
VESIKKDDIINVMNKMELTPLENGPYIVLIIHKVENMTTEAINSMLKFLEEPHEYVKFLLTCENLERVLPTIVSRCQALPLRLLPRDLIIKDALEQEVAPLEDIELLSSFYNSPQDIAKAATDANYLLIKELTLNFLSAFCKGKDEAVFYMQSSIIPKIKTKEMARMFLDLLFDFLKESLIYKANKKTIFLSYVTILLSLNKQANLISRNLAEVMKLRTKLDLNLNMALTLNYVVYCLTMN